MLQLLNSRTILQNHCSVESRLIVFKSLLTTRMEVVIVAFMFLKCLYPTFPAPLLITSPPISHMPNTAEHILLSQAWV